MLFSFPHENRITEKKPYDEQSIGPDLNGRHAVTRCLSITTVIAVILSVSADTQADDTFSMNGDGYELNVTSGYCADEGSACSGAVSKCVRLVVPVVTGKDLNAVSTQDQRWIQHQMSGSWSRLERKVDTRHRAYATLYEVSLIGELSLETVHNLQLSWSRRLRSRRIRTCTAVLVFGTAYIAAPFFFLYFDRLTNGDRRLLLAGGLVMSLTACGFLSLRHCVG